VRFRLRCHAKVSIDQPLQFAMWCAVFSHRPRVRHLHSLRPRNTVSWSSEAERAFASRYSPSPRVREIVVAALAKHWRTSLTGFSRFRVIALRHAEEDCSRSVNRDETPVRAKRTPQIGEGTRLHCEPFQDCFIVCGRPCCALAALQYAVHSAWTAARRLWLPRENAVERCQ